MAEMFSELAAYNIQSAFVAQIERPTKAY